LCLSDSRTLPASSDITLFSSRIFTPCDGIQRDVILAHPVMSSPPLRRSLRPDIPRAERFPHPAPLELHDLEFPPCLPIPALLNNSEIR